MMRFENQRVLRVDRWDFYAVTTLLALVLLLIPSWPKLLFFLDCYYHLSVMRGFADAGGWVGSAFWEFSPVGRPHLYPPLFHLIELVFFRLGLSPIHIGRLCDFLIYPIFLFSFWWPLRALFNKRLAFFTLLLLISSYPLYVNLINNIPFTLALIFSFLGYYFLTRGFVLSAWAALVCSFYSHTMMSLLGAAAFLGAVCLMARPQKTKGIVVLAMALISGMPLFVHQWAHLKFLSSFRAKEIYTADINVCLIGLAIFGIIWFLKEGWKEKYFFCLLAAMLVLFTTNRNRFFSGPGLVPVIFFAGFALDRLWCYLNGRFLKSLLYFFMGALCVVLFFLTPTAHVAGKRRGPSFSLDSSFLYYSDLKNQDYIKAKTIYHPVLTVKIVDLIDKYSAPEDIIFSNYSYAGGQVAVLSHRATSFAMLREVKPYASFDPMAVSKYVVWFKDPSEFSRALLKIATLDYGLKEVADTDLATLYENPHATARRRLIRSAVPERVCFCLMAFLACLICAEIIIVNKNEKKVDSRISM